jgi:hypothetical protein
LETVSHLSRPVHLGVVVSLFSEEPVFQAHVYDQNRGPFLQNLQPFLHDHDRHLEVVD